MIPSEVVDISGMAMAALPENTPEARVLVVDDETNIVELLSVSLKFQGFEVHTASNGPAALDKAREVRPDAVILDVMMPGMDGFGLLRRLRADGIDAPALFLTARDSLQDKIAGLTLGGDDYVTKPFSLEEVVARLRVILRRTGRGIEEPRNARLTFADIELDEDTHEVWKAGEPVSLSPTEFTLLRYFIINAGTVLSKPKILDHVWRYDFGGDVNVVESYVSYLRRKIDTGEKRLLHTLRGVSAYVLREPRADLFANNRGMAALRGRGIPLRVALVAATLVLVACGLLGVRYRGHHDPAPRPDQPRRRDAARRLPQLGAGSAPDAVAADRRTQSRPPAVGLLRARHRSRRTHLDGGQRPRGRARAARRQRRRDPCRSPSARSTTRTFSGGR